MTDAYIDRLSWKENGRWVHGPGSNFWIEPDGTHVEGEFQASKEVNPIKRKILVKKFLAMTPGEAKRAGQANAGFVTLRPDWDAQKGKVKILVMRQLVRAKFMEHDECREWLLGTEIKLIVEGNVWHDNFWGNCRCGAPRCDKTGKNHLGQILMDIRHELRGHGG